MNDDIMIPVAGFFIVIALLGGGTSNKKEVESKIVEHSIQKVVKQERSLARNFKASPDVIEGMDNISVKKDKRELSRAIEPNHKISNFNGLELE